MSHSVVFIDHNIPAAVPACRYGKRISMAQNDVIEIDLLKLIKALFKKAWLIVLVAVIAAGAVFGCVKMLHVPSYSAMATLYIKGSEQDTAYTSSNATTRTKTFVALLGTQTVLEEICDTAGFKLDAKALPERIKADALNASEMFAVTATGSSRKEAALLANATAEALRKNAALIHGEDSLVIFESASESTALENGSGVIQKSVVAAVLAACLVCAWIIAKELYADWKTGAAKKA